MKLSLSSPSLHCYYLFRLFRSIQELVSNGMLNMHYSMMSDSSAVNINMVSGYIYIFNYILITLFLSYTWLHATQGLDSHKKCCIEYWKSLSSLSSFLLISGMSHTDLRLLYNDYHPNSHTQLYYCMVLRWPQSRLDFWFRHKLSDYHSLMADHRTHSKLLCLVWNLTSNNNPEFTIN